MKIKADNKLFAIFAVMTGYSSFALGDAVFKHLSAVYSVPQLVVMLGTFSFLIYMVLSPVLGGLQSVVGSQNKKLHLIRGFLIMGQLITIIYAFSQLPMVTVYALVFVAPAFTALLAIPLLGEKPDLTRWLVVLFGFLGVLVILRPGMVPFDLASFATLASAFFISLANIMVRKIGGQETPFAFAFYTQIVVLPLAAMAMIPSFVMPDVEAMGWSAVGGFLNAMGMLGLILGFSRAPASSVASFHYIQILWGVVLGYLLFSDIPDALTLVGAGIIIASGLWLIRHEHKNIPDLSGS
ncbi:MAG: DMT family transporter [Rhodospirillales bacterium]|nr:DMT family transporter [Rhodospirillales bacterium]